MNGKTMPHLRIRESFTVLFSVSLLFSVLAQSSRAAGEPNFVATEVHQATWPVFGLAWGDFDPCHGGMEVACLLQYGSVLQLSPKVPSWDVAMRHNGETDPLIGRPTIGIGDVHSGLPGNEVITHAGKYPSMVTVVFYDPATGWSHEVLFNSTGLEGQSWGARVGDYDPCRPGDEILHIYEGVLDQSSGTLFSEVAGTWHEEMIFNGWVGYDSAAGDFNPNHTGPEIIFVCEGGPNYEIIAPEGNSTGYWPKRIIGPNNFENAGFVVKIADIDPCWPSNEVVYGTAWSNRIVMSRHNGDGPHEHQVLFTGNATEDEWRIMFDIAVGDILPANAGLEILGVDFTGSVYLVRRVEGTWQGHVIWQDPNSLYAVIAGDFLPARSGDEILVAGEAGRITLLTLTFTDNIADDGTVNFGDFAEVARYWRGNEPSADIGPWPIGDGIVDMWDVAVLADNWLHTAYWAQ